VNCSGIIEVNNNVHGDSLKYVVINNVTTNSLVLVMWLKQLARIW